LKDITIGILGTGWLGLPLAKQFIKDNYTVKGCTTSANKIATLENEGVLPYLIKLSEDDITGNIAHFLNNLSCLIINVPPRLRGKGPKESYVKKMYLLHQEIQKANVKKVIFVSSTAVYGNAVGTVDETTIPQPATASGRQLLASENIFREDQSLHTTILRLAGLIGPDRHPVTILATKKNLEDGSAPVNLIHLNDCITIIKEIVSKNHWNTVLNGVHPEHPTKREYYTAIAKSKNLQPPDYQDINSKRYKKIITCKNFLIKKKVFFTSLYT